MPFCAPREKNGERLGEEILKATALPPKKMSCVSFPVSAARQLLLDSGLPVTVVNRR